MPVRGTGLCRMFRRGLARYMRAPRSGREDPADDDETKATAASTENPNHAWPPAWGVLASSVSSWCASASGDEVYFASNA